MNRKSIHILVQLKLCNSIIIVIVSLLNFDGVVSSTFVNILILLFLAQDIAIL
jgi:uncharacterized membrane protein